MSEPECVVCGETVDGMSLWQFENGQERWVCDTCERELRGEYGIVCPREVAADAS